MNTISLWGIDFFRGTFSDCLEELEESLHAKKTTLVVTPNPEILYEASRDKSLLTILRTADYALPDGAGIFVAYQIMASWQPLLLKYLLFPFWCLRAVIHGPALEATYGARITGARLTRELLDFAEKNAIPVTIIDLVVHGDSPRDRAKRISQSSMQDTLSKKYPHIPFEVIASDSVPENLREHGIVFATHGGGQQEKILSELIKKYPATWLAMGVGGSIDLITGFRSPAPEIFQRLGIEWLYRLAKNPKRHYKRMKKVIRFLRLCLKSR